ncbi:MAG: aminotransferase class III-fold pyridoxal phosphate-dependent enzyme, partial [Clostridia bacterium]|nr:aminotransferase class III-fold pyridoxal phosphate-dependent enzyme [Clostridia bacterium]
GLPIGACLLGEKVENVFAPGDHGSTFGGNPAACAGGVSILSRIDDALLAGVRARSAYIFDALRGAPGVEGVSGMGLMIGIKPVKPARDVVNRCIENGVLCLTAKDRVRLLPALNIPMEQLERAVAVLKDALAE